MQKNIPFRIGIGHDTHRLEPGDSHSESPCKSVRIGGVDIPHEKRMIGHSDADLLLHAITDALLGAAAMGDIGHLFPDTDPANRGRDSLQMLGVAKEMVTEAGWSIGNIDCILFAQKPKIGPHRPAIRQQIAKILDISIDQIEVKAKTGESIGPIGREEAISAEAIALLYKS
jgi:2-C-methyl-D-erythritol 2,4-cyclodiphosphate synthase